MRIEEVTKTNSEMDVSRKVILNIIHTQALISENMNDFLKPYDLSSEQFNVLRILKGQKNVPANMSVIQERMITKNSNTTRLIDKLLHKEYVNRKVCIDNRRKIEITITQKGLNVLNELNPKLIEHETFFAQNLSQNELEQLNNLLEKFRNY